MEISSRGDAEASILCTELIFESRQAVMKVSEFGSECRSEAEKVCRSP